MHIKFVVYRRGNLSFKKSIFHNNNINIVIIIIIIKHWHNSDQNNYRYSTGNIKSIPKVKLQMQTHKYNNSKSHLECLLK